MLGNYSRFIRPGYKRIKITGANNLAGLMGTAFITPDSSKIIIVYVNWESLPITVSHVFDNLPANLKVNKITPYVTDMLNNLSVKQLIFDRTSYLITPQ